MIYALLKDGVFTGRTQSFDQKPDPNPAKKLEWLEFVDSGNPSFNPATQKLNPEVFTVGNGKVTRSRPVVSLSDKEKLEHVLRNRREAYQTGTLAIKGVTGDEISGLGFWIDALTSQIQAILTAQDLTAEAEFKALVDMRNKAKSDNPK